jgi:ethanolamine utilization protein EutN
MLRARVIGNVWSSRRLAEVPAGAFLEVEVDGGSRLVAFDVLGTGIGESVLVATGSVASAWFPDGAAPPIDALIIGSIDDQRAGGSPTT